MHRRNCIQTDGLCVPWLMGKGIQAAKLIMILTWGETAFSLSQWDIYRCSNKGDFFAKLLEKYCSLKLWESAFFTANAMKYNGMLIFPFWLIRNYWAAERKTK